MDHTIDEDAIQKELATLRTRIAELEATSRTIKTSGSQLQDNFDSTARGHTFIEGAPDMWARVDAQGTILDFIPVKGMESAFPLDAIIGERFTEFLPAEIGEAAMDCIADALDSGRARIFEYTIPFPFKTDEPRDFEARLVVAGKSEVVVIVRDVTDRKRRESRLREARKMDALSELAAGVSEKLSGVLAEIIVFSELGGRYLDPKERLYDYCQSIKAATLRASQLSTELMTLAHRRSSDSMVFDANLVMADMEEVFRRLLGPGSELMSVLSPGPMLVKMDPAMLKQALLNLVVNSVEAMPAGGLLVVATGTVTLDEAYVTEHPDATPGRHAHFKITDYGPGMAPEVLERAFEPYFTTRGHEGALGMGLPTTYGIVRQAGGHMTVESEPGKGATFNVYIPLAGEGDG